MSAPSTRPFVLAYNDLETSFLVPTLAYFLATQLADLFMKTLPQKTVSEQDESSQIVPQSAPELLALFLVFASDFHDPQDPSSLDSILHLALQEFETTYLDKNTQDIHLLAASLLTSSSSENAKSLIKNYIKTKYALKSPFAPAGVTLFGQNNDDVKLFSVFGGQGKFDYFDELREIYDVYYPIVSSYISEFNSLLLNLSAGKKDNFTQGFNLLDWLTDSSKIPDQDYLLSANISCPLICVIQLLHFVITAKFLNLQSPAQLTVKFGATTGHSQGIVTAIAISASHDAQSFLENSKKAISALFFIGLRVTTTYPNYSLPPSITQDSIDNNEGVPSPMLSIRDLSKEQVQKFIDLTNEHLSADKQVNISLCNGGRHIVVSGPPQSLYGLNLSLRKAKADESMNQSRIPFSERKLQFTNRFLSITSPFHSHLLNGANAEIELDLKTIQISPSELRIPVIDFNNGENLQNSTESNVLVRAAHLITDLPVNWVLACNAVPQTTHIVDFGPGGVSGIGALTNHNNRGTGVRIIIAGALDVGLTEEDQELGFKQDLFDNSGNVQFAANWLKEYKPTLIKNSNTGELFLKTKFSELLCKPPLLIPGMTPSTVDPEFVTATLNAGYYIELGGGGYFENKSFEAALTQVAENVKPGTGIGINMIYVNPRMLQWGIPSIKNLRENGFPIQSLTIGAGVPSLEVATEYIETLGLSHLDLKPGSVDSIYQVIEIAKAHPTFPIVLQWTGGRGGGHHSFEDFHQPILATYAAIRRCPNIILIAGSGFGSHEDTYPYLTGEWSKKFNYPAMPLDGFLFGSRVMIAKEAKLSVEGKELIASCSGVEDSEWEGTYKKATGGIMTVRSEMGEPIHKIATRGVKLWEEFDKKYFSLKSKDLLKKLKQDKHEIVKKLNADFQRPWFGVSSKTGAACDIKDMTYSEISRRLLAMIHSSRSGRWLDNSLTKMLYNWLVRVEERFITTETESLFTYSELQKSPAEILQKLDVLFPASAKQLINAYDNIYFIKLCSNPAQKPVPFVPVLDESFERYFKKDSLFQCQDLDFVPDHDIQRTCILHGPVAAKYTTKANEPIKDLMDGINRGLINNLLQDFYNGNEANVPTEEFVGGYKPVTTVPSSEFSAKSSSAKNLIFELGNDIEKVDSVKWMECLAGATKNWRFAFVTAKFVVQGYNYVKNPIQQFIEPFANARVEILNPDDSAKTVFTLFDKLNKLVEMKLLADGVTIEVLLFTPYNKDNNLLPLQLLYKYNPSDGFVPILEIMDDRNDRIKRFYWKLWFGSNSNYDDNFDLTKPVYGEKPVEITAEKIKQFTQIIQNSNDYYVGHAPMDFAIVLCWERIMKYLFHSKIDGDLLKLVHLSNSFNNKNNDDEVESLKIGDLVNSKSEVLSVVNTPGGKRVKVTGIIFKVNSDGSEGEPVMDLVSEFFYRGHYTDFENTFDKIVQNPVKVPFKSIKDIAVLKSKEWAILKDDIDVLGETLTFNCETEVSFKNDKIFSSVKTVGKIMLELPTKEMLEVGEVDYQAGESFGNPVLDYLQRNGTSIEETKLFEQQIPISSSEQPLTLPVSNVPYAVVSGDYNPIHVCPHFAKYAQLPGTITHGMFTSASVRKLVELWGADNVAKRVKAYKANFTGMVLPGTELSTELKHIGMINGRKLLKISTKNVATGELVLDAQAEISQPSSTYLFTGQGSQEQNMGMDLYKTSSVAKAVWDRADAHLMQQYGFSILDIVKNNPKEFTIHFGGVKGREIKKNYTSMVFETLDANGNLKSEKIFKEITSKSKSYTFKSDTGLLSATQFTQPALTLMEKAAFEDLKSKGLVPENCVFAGHSLGEYSALASLGDVMPIESLVEVVFYRGMTMQVAVERDDQGRSNYGMIACNPSRVSSTFDDAALRFVVDSISKRTGWLLEIVNYNVENQQYVAAGDLRGLDTLTNVLNVFKIKKIDIVKLQEEISVEKIGEYLNDITDEVAKQSLEKPQPINLQRGFACIPLKGISVPFHSSYLRGGVQPFKKFLLKKIPMKALKVDNLVNKYIPNLTAKPFEVTKEYFEEVYQLTKSERIKTVLDNWDSYYS